MHVSVFTLVLFSFLDTLYVVRGWFHSVVFASYIHKIPSTRNHLQQWPRDKICDKHTLCAFHEHACWWLKAWVPKRTVYRQSGKSEWLVNRWSWPVSHFLFEGITITITITVSTWCHCNCWIVCSLHMVSDWETDYFLPWKMYCKCVSTLEVKKDKSSMQPVIFVFTLLQVTTAQLGGGGGRCFAL